MVRSALQSQAARSVRQLANPAARRSFGTPVDDRLAFAARKPIDHLQSAVNATAPRYDWTRDEIRQIYNTPLMELAHQSVSSHRADPASCTLCN